MTHGDFHDSQLLIDDAGAITGIVDLDGVAPGHRLDDLATMLGRIWTSGRTTTPGNARFDRYGQELFASFARHCDPSDLCRRIAGVVFGRATGPFRVQHPDWQATALTRIELAEPWLTAAEAGTPPAS